MTVKSVITKSLTFAVLLAVDGEADQIWSDFRHCPLDREVSHKSLGSFPFRILIHVIDEEFDQFRSDIRHSFPLTVMSVITNTHHFGFFAVLHAVDGEADQIRGDSRHYPLDEEAHISDRLEEV